MPPMDHPAGPGVRTARAMRDFIVRHQRALRTAWELSPNATVVSTAVAMVFMLKDIDP